MTMPAFNALALAVDRAKRWMKMADDAPERLPAAARNAETYDLTRSYHYSGKVDDWLVAEIKDVILRRALAHARGVRDEEMEQAAAELLVIRRELVDTTLKAAHELDVRARAILERLRRLKAIEAGDDPRG